MTAVAARRRRPGVQNAVLLAAIAAVLATISAIAIFGNTRPGLRADILGPRRVEPAEVATYTVSVRDTAGAVLRVEIDFGDGESEVLARRRDPACASGPTTEAFDVDHAYHEGRVYTARARVVSGECGAPREVDEAVRTVQVKRRRS